MTNRRAPTAWVHPGRYAGRVAVVTGAAAGLGLALVRRLAAEGAHVAAADIDPTALQRVTAAASAAALPIRVDVSDEPSVQAMVATVVDRFGRIDVLFNNAAATGPDVTGRDGSLLDLDVGVWDRTMAVNLRGVMLGCKHAIPVMIANGGGSIVNTSSTGAHQAAAVRAAYGTSKAGVESLTRYVATMFGRQGIRCNAVAPGYMANAATASREPPGQAAMAGYERLLPRAAAPEEIAALAVFLGSDEASALTGQVYVADSGRLAHKPSYSVDLALAAAGDHLGGAGTTRVS